MTTLGDLRKQVLRLLDDPEGGGYDEALLLDAICASLDAILPWVPLTKTSSFTGDGSAKTFVLPTDLYDIESVLDDQTGEVLPRSSLAPGQFIGTEGKTTNDWLEYPTGSISFGKAIANGVTYTLYYLAYHPHPIEMDDAFVLSTPEHTRLGLALYSMSYALLPAAVGVAEVGPWKTKVDSGNPEHNPLQKSVQFILEAFTREMNRHPKHQRAVK